MMMSNSFDLENLVTFRLSRLADTLERAATLTYGREFDLNLTAWRTLAILNQHEPTTVKDISRRSRIDKGWISRSVARLESRGLLARMSNQQDNRSVLLRLTEDGRRLVAQIAPLSLRRHEALLSALGEDESERFLKALDFIQRQIDSMVEQEESAPATASEPVRRGELSSPAPDRDREPDRRRSPVPPTDG